MASLDCTTTVIVATTNCLSLTFDVTDYSESEPRTLNGKTLLFPFGVRGYVAKVVVQQTPSLLLLTDAIQDEPFPKPNATASPFLASFT